MILGFGRKFCARDRNLEVINVWMLFKALILEEITKGVNIHREVDNKVILCYIQDTPN